MTAPSKAERDEKRQQLINRIEDEACWSDSDSGEPCGMCLPCLAEWAVHALDEADRRERAVRELVTPRADTGDGVCTNCGTPGAECWKCGR